MQVSVKKLDNALRHKLNFSIPPEWIDPQVEKKLHEYAKKVKLPGFRPGKIPLNILKQRFGEAFSQDVILEKMPEWIFDAFEIKQLQVAGFTSIDLPNRKLGNICEFSVTIEILPEIPDSAYENLSFDVHENEVKEEDIQKVLWRIAYEKAEYVETEVSSGLGQRISLQYRLAEQTDEDFTSEMFYFLGSNPDMQEFDKKLEGLHAGDRIELEFDPGTFRIGTKPKDEFKRNFLIQVNKVEKYKEEPQINDALAEKLGFQEGGIDQLRKEVTKELESNMKKDNEMSNHLSIQDALYQRNQKTKEIPIPLCMYLCDDAGIGSYPLINEQNLPDLSEDVIEIRRKEALHNLICKHIFTKHHGTEIEDSELKEFLLEEAQSYDDPDQYIKYVMSDDNSSQRARTHFLQKFVLNKIMETAKPITKQVDAPQSAS
ncbi:MAG: trigger factor [Gammaproteobacteria bacterium]|nr:trigger factor [Gammaproteobacteria bacterium]MCY4273916.1 trigger factor [Gammaproteobacteria bacterium]